MSPIEFESQAGLADDLAERGIEPVIPPRSDRKTPIEYDREAYKRRNLIERCVNRLKSSAASQPVTRKPPELIFRCYVSRQQDSGSKLSTRPSETELTVKSGSVDVGCPGSRAGR
jgi:hypothetical protein